MFGWSISASACRSASNRASTCLRVHPGLDQLDGDVPLDRLGLLGPPDAAHAALADRLDERVLAGDHGARPLVLAGVVGGRFGGTGRRVVGGVRAGGARRSWGRGVERPAASGSRNRLAPAWAARSASTRCRRASSAPQTRSRYAERAAGSVCSRASPTIVVRSGLSAGTAFPPERVHSPLLRPVPKCATESATNPNAPVSQGVRRPSPGEPPVSVG